MFMFHDHLVDCASGVWKLVSRGSGYETMCKYVNL